MASMVTLPVTLTAPAAGYTKPAKGKLTSPISRPVYPAGPSYISAARRHLLQRSFAEDDKAVEEQRSKAAAEAEKEGGDGNVYPGLGEEQESAAILASDPKEWKKQDHYAVLGLGSFRYLANNEQIKVAHRRKVLRHHPDKKAGSKGTNDDAFFKCIQKAHETLNNTERRRQFDSVDWNIEDEVPNPKSVAAEGYCVTFAPVFAREARFSKIQPVPGFGGNDAPKKEVEGFYDFWYNFDSWRSFEWHDKEVNEGSDNRDDKRFTEKKNKSERARRKKEDNVRLRTLVDDVLANDPRIKRIKAEEKAARLAKKNGGGAVINGAPPKPMTPAEKQKAAEAKAAAEAATKEQEKKAAEMGKAEREAAKKAKEAARKNLKKWKKAIATVIASSNYFLPENTQAPASTIEKQLAELDLLVEVLDPEDVRDLKDKVEHAGQGQPAKDAIKEKVQKVEDKSKFVEFA